MKIHAALPADGFPNHLLGNLFRHEFRLWLPQSSLPSSRLDQRRPGTCPRCQWDTEGVPGSSPDCPNI